MIIKNGTEDYGYPKKNTQRNNIHVWTKDQTCHWEKAWLQFPNTTLHKDQL